MKKPDDNKNDKDKKSIYSQIKDFFFWLKDWYNDVEENQKQWEKFCAYLNNMVDYILGQRVIDEEIRLAKEKDERVAKALKWWKFPISSFIEWLWTGICTFWSQVYKFLSFFYPDEILKLWSLSGWIKYIIVVLFLFLLLIYIYSMFEDNTFITYKLALKMLIQNILIIWFLMLVVMYAGPFLKKATDAFLFAHYFANLKSDSYVLYSIPVVIFFLQICYQHAMSK